jgi:hypothetical protein
MVRLVRRSGFWQGAGLVGPATECLWGPSVGQDVSPAAFTDSARARWSGWGSTTCKIRHWLTLDHRFIDQKESFHFCYPTHPKDRPHGRQTELR